jgi:DNA-binding transcriptional LysR family regulator
VASNVPLQSQHSYYLVTPERSHSAPLQRFAAWLQAQAAQSSA